MRPARAGAASGTAVAGLFHESGAGVGFSGTAVAGLFQVGVSGGVAVLGGAAGWAVGGSGNDALDCANALRTGTSVHTASSHHPSKRHDPTIGFKL